MMNGFESRMRTMIQAFVELDSSILYVLIGLLIVSVILLVLKAAIKSAITVALFCAICMCLSWVKTEVIDSNGIKMKEDMLTINNYEFSMKDITGLDADPEKSMLLIKTKAGNVGVKIESNIGIVKELLELVDTPEIK